jgi:hypothetical protein
LFFAALGGPVAVGVMTCALAGCPSTASTTTYTPITGILIRSSTLVAGHGCGTRPTQVYKYLAVVSYADDAGAPLPGQPPVASHVFDCFADGIFSNLSANDAGDLSFNVAIYAWNKDTFPAQLDCVNASYAMPCPGEMTATALSLASSAVWTTTCSGMEQSGATQVAACPCPLAPAGTSGCMDAAAAGGEAGAGMDAAADGAGMDAAADGGEAGPASAAITVSTTTFTLADGGTISCPNNYEGAQASYTATSDAGASDAGAVMGQTSWVPCPQPLVIANASPGYSYTLHVTLSNAEGGATVANATCNASPSAGASTPAMCGPAQLGP